MMSSFSIFALERITCDAEGYFWNDNKLIGTIMIKFPNQESAEITTKLVEILVDDSKNPVNVNLSFSECEAKGISAGFKQVSIYCPKQGADSLTTIVLSKDQSGKFTEGIAEFKEIFSTVELKNCMSN
ncbi:hypothetical protein M900_2336 [Bacteriovorax sp. Seq25_V]|nr:hypothetical protein M900_2336 [Bacteriovorax sp. Seq25_V]